MRGCIGREELGVCSVWGGGASIFITRIMEKWGYAKNLKLIL